MFVSIQFIYLIFQNLMLWKFWISGVVTSVLILLGLLGNSCAVFILQKPKMRNAFNQLLITLCIVDSIFLISNVPTVVTALGSSKFLENFDFYQGVKIFLPWLFIFFAFRNRCFKCSDAWKFFVKWNHSTIFNCCIWKLK